LAEFIKCGQNCSAVYGAFSVRIRCCAAWPSGKHFSSDTPLFTRVQSYRNLVRLRGGALSVRANSATDFGTVFGLTMAHAIDIVRAPLFNNPRIYYAYNNVAYRRTHGSCRRSHFFRQINLTDIGQGRPVANLNLGCRLDKGTRANESLFIL
jgi:hypothetical protein